MPKTVTLLCMCPELLMCYKQAAVSPAAYRLAQSFQCLGFLVRGISPRSTWCQLHCYAAMTHATDHLDVLRRKLEAEC